MPRTLNYRAVRIDETLRLEQIAVPRFHIGLPFSKAALFQEHNMAFVIWVNQVCTRIDREQGCRNNPSCKVGTIIYMMPFAGKYCLLE